MTNGPYALLSTLPSSGCSNPKAPLSTWSYWITPVLDSCLRRITLSFSRHLQTTNSTLSLFLCTRQKKTWKIAPSRKRFVRIFLWKNRLLWCAYFWNNGLLVHRANKRKLSGLGELSIYPESAENQTWEEDFWSDIWTSALQHFVYQERAQDWSCGRCWWRCQWLSFTHLTRRIK